MCFIYSRSNRNTKKVLSPPPPIPTEIEYRDKGGQINSLFVLPGTFRGVSMILELKNTLASVKRTLPSPTQNIEVELLNLKGNYFKGFIIDFKVLIILTKIFFKII